MPQNKAACCSLFLAFAEEFGVECCTAPHVTLGPPAAQAETPRPGAALHSLQALFPADRAGLCGLDQAVYSFPRQATSRPDGRGGNT